MIIVFTRLINKNNILTEKGKGIKKRKKNQSHTAMHRVGDNYHEITIAEVGLQITINIEVVEVIQ